MLTFPVIKQNSDKNKIEDNKKLPPTGSGRYVYTEENGQYFLTANQKWRGGAVNIEKIPLVNCPDNDSLRHNISSGSVSIFYDDLSEQELRGVTGQNIPVVQNNLVYLGINSKNAFLQRPEVRCALSLALNRQKLCSEAFFGMAVPAKGPFGSFYTAAENAQLGHYEENLQTCIAELENLGYNKGANGFFQNDGKQIKLRLLVNSENSRRLSAAQKCAESLCAAGLETTVSVLGYDAYIAALSRGEFELYLGEIKNRQNMDLSPLFDSAVNYGVPVFEFYSAYRAGAVTIEEFLETFYSDCPFLPLCYREGVLSYSVNLKGKLRSTPTDIFYNIEELSVF
jgi:peptide/nickel transport system substrate-binding protein